MGGSAELAAMREDTIGGDLDTVVIGAGQAGLSTSFFLRKHGVEHVVLERSGIASSWKSRWDSFTLVTPNAMNALPDFPPDGPPEAFLSRDEVVRYLERFADIFDPPLRTGVTVTSVAPGPAIGAAGNGAVENAEAGNGAAGNAPAAIDAAESAVAGRSGSPRVGVPVPASTARPEGGFRVETDRGDYRCRNVVVATGTFQRPRLPAFADRLPPDVVQIHSSEYRNPEALPEGAVLVVGSGQSGAQIADELRGSGRRVYLSVSRAERVPRRYRGRDVFDWLRMAGLFERTLDMLDHPSERFAAHPHVSGRDGGRTLNLRRFGREGVVLVGKVDGVANGRLRLRDDLEENLRAADEFAQGVCDKVDQAIEKAGLDAPPPSDEEVVPEEWKPPESTRELSLDDEGISAVVWATGYRCDFTWIRECPLEASGYPVQRQGVTPVPGLYFSGLHWLNKHKSGLLYGVAEDAEHVARHLARR